MKQVLIVEDNIIGAERLKQQLLQDFAEVLQIINIVGTIAEAVACIKAEQPELVFLDIHLTDGDGFEVLDQTLEQSYAVIFTTAYGAYSLKAFDYAALHYLVKPIDQDDLKVAVHRFLQQYERINPQQIKFLEQATASPLTKLAITSMTEIVFLEVADIIYFEADQNYSVLHLKDGSTIIATKTLGFYEDLLTAQGFYRIHGKYLIHLKYVDKYLKGKGGMVTMINGSSLSVSVRRKQGFLEEMLSI